MNTMTTMMILCAGVLSRLFSFFFLGYVFFASSHKNTFAPVRKTLRQKKERILVILGWCFYNKRRDFETTRFSFSFLLRTQGGKKKIHSRQKESFHHLQKRARALKEHRHTRAHTKPRERERKRRRRFFLLL